jgi:hypothetical protein
VIRRNWLENFQQVEPFVSRTLTETDLHFIRAWVERFLEEHWELFAERVAGGFVRDCDGDIHSENICLTERVYIFDCIEFMPGFVFPIPPRMWHFSMDLGTVAGAILRKFFFRSIVPLPLTPACWRCSISTESTGHLCGKVESFRLDDPLIDTREKVLAQEGESYFRLARGLILRRTLAPCLVVFCGLMGVGKSTLARELSFEIGFELLSSDILRKELAGLPKTLACHDGYNQRFIPEFTRHTYREMFLRAEQALRGGRGVVLDASFPAGTTASRQPTWPGGWG